MPVDDEVCVRGHTVETDRALDHKWPDPGKHSRGQLQTIPVLSRMRRPIDSFRIDDLPAGVVGDLESGDAVDGKTVNLSGRRVGDEHRESLRLESPRVVDLLPPQRLAQDTNG